MKRKTFVFVLSLLLGCSISLLTFCDLSGSGGGTTGGTPTNEISRYGGTQSPGDYWEWIIDRENLTFSAKNYGETFGSAVQNVYSGTIEVLPSKFLKFTITETDDPAAEGGISFGIEIPGTAILVQPAGENQACVAATNIGGNPQAATYNWVTFPSADFSGGSAYGSSTITSIDPGAGTFEQTITFYQWDGVSSTPVVPGGVFADGKVYVPDFNNPMAIAVFTPSGCFSSDAGSDGGNFGVVQPGSPIDVSVLTGREYRGFVSVFKDETDGGTATFPTWMSPDTGTMMTGGGYVGSSPEGDIDNATITEVKFTDAEQAAAGLLTGVTTKIGEHYSQDLVIAAGIVQGKYVLFGIGKDSDGVWLNFLVMEQ